MHRSWYRRIHKAGCTGVGAIRPIKRAARARSRRVLKLNVETVGHHHGGAPARGQAPVRRPGCTALDHQQARAPLAAERLVERQHNRAARSSTL